MGCVVINSMGWIPAIAQTAGNHISLWCLTTAIAAIGVKTQLKELVAVGIKPILLMLGGTVFLAALVLAVLHWGA